MKYSRTFANEYARITICTNSNRLHKLIENFLDFPRHYRSLKPKINISLSLQEFQLKQSTFKNTPIYQNLYKQNKVFSSINTRVISVTTDLKTNTAKAILFEFDESRKEYILDFSIMQPLYLILGRHGFFHMHASMVSKNNYCVIMSGPAGSGKSTLGFILAQNGFQLLCDDDCFIKNVKNECRVFPFPTKMGLTRNILNQYPNIAKHIVKNYRYGNKERVSLKDIVDRHEGSPICKAVVYPKYRVNGKLSINKVPKPVGLKRLIDDCHCVYPEKQSKKMIWTFYRFAQKINFFELIYNDTHLSKIPAVIEEAAGL